MNPNQILSKKFSKALRGISENEVRSYLKELATAIEGLTDENSKLRSHIAMLETRLKASQELEQKLTRMLRDMESTSAKIIDQSKTNSAAMSTQIERQRRVLLTKAQEEAAIIIRDAEKKAQRVLDEADGKRKSLIEEIGMLHARRMALIARIKSLLSSQVEFLNALDRDLKDPTANTIPIRRERKTKEGIGSAELQSIIQKLEDQKAGT